VLDAVHDDVVERLRARAADVVVGDPADRETFNGPVVDERAVQRYEAAVAEAGRDGTVVAGGGRPSSGATTSSRPWSPGCRRATGSRATSCSSRS
jgi:acyl-CoA reductase-like NAD-dependent aldehyde dehydrogenase